MASTELITKTKLARRIKEVPSTLDALVETAAFTYVKCHFGDPDDYDRLKKAYDEQKARLTAAQIAVATDKGWTVN